MLASILPGLREVRTPLVVGYLWFFIAWILFRDKVPEDAPSDGFVFARLFELSDLLGTTVVLAAVSFAAYLCGSVSKLSMSARFRRTPAFVVSFFKFVDRISGKRLSRRLRQRGWVYANDAMLPRSFRRAARDLTATAFGTMDSKSIRAVVASVMKDRDDLRTRLLVADRELYGEYDRLEAEAEFRAGLTPPLFVLAIILAVDLSWWWLLAMIPLAYFVWQGGARDIQAVAVLMRAIQVKRIEYTPYIESDENEGSRFM